jgi:D-alanyl-D-alanine endopeptidase (penicillin-binding protein 7)
MPRFAPVISTLSVITSLPENPAADIAMLAGMGQYLKKSLLVSAMPNVLKVLPLAILLALGTHAGAATAPPTTTKPAAAAAKSSGPAKSGTAPTANSKKPGTARTAKTATAATPAKARSAATNQTARRSVPAKSATARTVVAKASKSPARPSPRPAWAAYSDGGVGVESGSALVVDATGEVVYAKNPDEILPIASITKLMTALVVLDAGLPLDETITISEDDKDHLRNSHSRLLVGSQLTRREALHVALMSSENRAAAALGRTHPAGKAAFVQLMNAKARQLGMLNTRFADTTGLDGDNVSTARDLVKLARAASAHPLIREFSTTAESEIDAGTRSTPMLYRNSNRLVRGGHWDIQLSKTGYLNEAGRCLVMQAEVAGRPLVFVFLSGPGRQTPMGDANRIRVWLQNGSQTG